MKWLWVLAGVNGAGKSTFYELFLAKRQIPFVNADVIAKEMQPEDPAAVAYEAAEIADRQRHALLEEGRTFCMETVFSHPSKVEFLKLAKDSGYRVHLVFIHLDSVELHKARVEGRVLRGGHAVPHVKIEQRHPRTLAHFAQALPYADEVWILDNSSAATPFRPLAKLKRGRMVEAVAPLPDWLQPLLAPYSTPTDSDHEPH